MPKFGKIDEQLEKIDRKFEKIDWKFEQIETRFDQLEEKIDLIDDKLTHTNKCLDVVVDEISDHDRRISAVEAGLVI